MNYKHESNENLRRYVLEVQRAQKIQQLFNP